MKNIHTLPTNKPSRLHLAYDKDFYLSVEPFIQLDTKNYKSFNIYITFDEEIKDCWVLNTRTNEVYFLKGYYGIQPIAKKIILTTDQDLIKDGVQSIDDEFLEWFVNNPSCERVEVEFIEDNWGYYKIIIPKEELTISDEAKQRAANYMSLKGALEPKQETLEEAAEKFANDCTLVSDAAAYKGFINGAKWQSEQYGLMEIELSHTKRLLASCEKALEDRDKQQERMYSEEDMKNAFDSAREFNSLDGIVDVHIVLPMGGDMSDLQPLHFTFEEWFEQFKKK